LQHNKHTNIPISAAAATTTTTTWPAIFFTQRQKLLPHDDRKQRSDGSNPRQLHKHTAQYRVHTIFTATLIIIYQIIFNSTPHTQRNPVGDLTGDRCVRTH